MKGLVPTLKELIQWPTKKILHHIHGFQSGSHILRTQAVLCLVVQGATGQILGEISGPLVLLTEGRLFYIK